MSTYDDFRSDCWIEGCRNLATGRMGGYRYCQAHQDHSAIFCEHANEVPAHCPCEEYCYCKDHTCKWKSANTIKNSNKLIAWLKE